jgi:glutamate 5-kinase
MRLYSSSFKKHGLNVAQLLLTHGDIDSLMHRENARNTLDRLLEHGVIPIIN